MTRSLLTFFLSAAAFVIATPASAAKEQRPNFLFILTDDQAPDTIGAYGNTVCSTPNIDRLAKEGMLFHDAHHMGSWSGAVCRPSRTMIMTGKTVWHIPGAKGKKPPKIRGTKNAKADAAPPADDPAQQSMPALFNRAGYDTMRTCKIGNTYPPANALFTVCKDATKRGSTPETGSEWHGDQVMDFLNAHDAEEDPKPFLIFFGFSHPHDPRNGPEDLVKKYGADNSVTAGPELSQKAPPLPINYLPAHPFDHGHPGLRDENSVQGVGKKRDELTVRNEIGRNYACIESVDTQVGRVLAKLEAMGELENTYIIFTADHGMSVGRHGLMGKQNLYEHTWRVPFIVRGPGIEAGSETKAMVYLLDVLPTLCDLGGIGIPDVVEGRSFRPVLEGKAKTARPHVYGVYSGGTKPGIRAIKTGRWKLVKWDVLDGAVHQTQLFDLESNPDELLAEHHDKALAKQIGNTPKADQSNLADDPKFAEKRAELEALLQAEMERLDDPNPLWDQKK